MIIHGPPIVAPQDLMAEVNRQVPGEPLRLFKYQKKPDACAASPSVEEPPEVSRLIATLFILHVVEMLVVWMCTSFTRARRRWISQLYTCRNRWQEKVFKATRLEYVYGHLCLKERERENECLFWIKPLLSLEEKKGRLHECMFTGSFSTEINVYMLLKL